MRGAAGGLALFCLLVAATAAAPPPLPDFSLHKLDSGAAGPTLLVIGGIQGDEPGGFTAASLLVTRYKITSGRLWVVPNLNFPSIIRNSRGIHGDMNRKFASLTPQDPEFATVERIKKIMLDLRVDIIVDLHDGSGWYYPTYVDEQRNPQQWGQSIIIDQETVAGSQYGNLLQLAGTMAQQANAHIDDAAKAFHVKNTRTWAGDPEMEKSLSYYAVRNHAPAVAVEATKSLDTENRALVHLYAIEALMQGLGIGFERPFALTPAALRQAMDVGLTLSFYDAKVTLDLSNARKSLPRFPVPRRQALTFSAQNPLVAVSDGGDALRVSYGNRSLTRLQPQYLDFDAGLTAVQLQVDGVAHKVPIGSSAPVRMNFKVMNTSPYRAKVVGLRQRRGPDDSGMTLGRKELQESLSLDQDGNKYRVEFYRGERFAGMIIVDFAREPALAPSRISKAQNGESAGG